MEHFRENLYELTLTLALACESMNPLMKTQTHNYGYLSHFLHVSKATIAYALSPHVRICIMKSKLKLSVFGMAIAVWC